MMKASKRKNSLLYLIRPEDSSSWDGKGMEAYSCDENKKEIVYSTAKFLVWYVMALAVSIFLSRLQ